MRSTWVQIGLRSSVYDSTESRLHAETDESHSSSVVLLLLSVHSFIKFFLSPAYLYCVFVSCLGLSASFFSLPFRSPRQPNVIIPYWVNIATDDSILTSDLTTGIAFVTMAQLYVFNFYFYDVPSSLNKRSSNIVESKRLRRTPNRPTHLANFDFENNYQNLYGGCTESLSFSTFVKTQKVNSIKDDCHREFPFGSLFHSRWTKGEISNTFRSWFRRWSNRATLILVSSEGEVAGKVLTTAVSVHLG